MSLCAYSLLLRPCEKVKELAPIKLDKATAVMKTLISLGEVYVHVHVHVHACTCSCISTRIHVHVHVIPHSAVQPEYFCHLDHKGMRTDAATRPELTFGSVEFTATTDYCKVHNVHVHVHVWQ